MRLVDLAPRWYGHPDGRTRLGVSFECPHCFDDATKLSMTRLAIPFANPIDGGTPEPNANGCTWQREGDTFDTLTLSPSIDASTSGHWHGFIRNGEVA